MEMRFTEFLWHTAGLADNLVKTSVLVLLFSTSAWAQTAGDDIRGHVQQGQRVSITDTQGRKFNARIVDIGDQALTLAQGRKRGDVPYTEIARIDHQKDPIWNGALVGLGVGAALGALAASTADSNYRGDDPFCGMGFFDDCSRDSAIRAAFGWISVGTLVGVSLDALIYRRDREIYRRGGDSQIAVSPAFGPGYARALVSVSW